MNNGKAYAQALLDLSNENNIDINQIVSELQQENILLKEKLDLLISKLNIEL